MDADDLARIVGGSVDIGAYEAAADLQLTQAVSASATNLGGTLTYTMTVTNTGPYDTAGVRMVDTLPAGIVLQSATSSQGSCSGTNVVTCDLGALSKGGSATVTLVAVALQAGIMVNTATVTSQVPDPNPANSTASVSTVVGGNGNGVVFASGAGCGLIAGADGKAEVSWCFGISFLLAVLWNRKKSRSALPLE